MSFWESDLGEVTGKAEDAFIKEMKGVIPDGTMALAKVESFINHEHNGLAMLLIDWILTEGDYKGFKVSQKLKCIDADPRDKDPARTRHRALNMLKLMYQQFGIKPKHANAPTDDDLLVFKGKIAGIKVREWSMPKDDGTLMEGNFVSEVHPSQGLKCEVGTKLVVTHTNTVPAQGSLLDSAFDRNRPKADPGVNGLDDDIPF